MEELYVKYFVPSPSDTPPPAPPLTPHPPPQNEGIIIIDNVGIFRALLKVLHKNCTQCIYY